ncbi:unnamed protein product, partial [Prorocentrum cordatum]
PGLRRPFTGRCWNALGRAPGKAEEGPGAAAPEADGGGARRSGASRGSLREQASAGPECAFCDGLGRRGCEACGGHGSLVCRACDGMPPLPCPACGGSGALHTASRPSRARAGARAAASPWAPWAGGAARRAGGCRRRARRVLRRPGAPVRGLLRRGLDAVHPLRAGEGLPLAAPRLVAAAARRAGPPRLASCASPAGAAPEAAEPQW